MINICSAMEFKEMVAASINISRTTCETFKARNFNKLDIDEIHSRHSVSVVFNGANIHVHNFVDQLKVTISNILDDLALLQHMINVLW